MPQTSEAVSGVEPEPTIATTTPIENTSATESPEEETKKESLENIELGFAIAEDSVAEEQTTSTVAAAPAAPPAPIAANKIEQIENSSDEEVVAEKMAEINNPRPIVGYVYSRASGEPLIGAKIQAIGTEQETITDLEGRFKLEVDENTQALGITHLGFNQKQVSIQQQDSLAIELLEDAGIALSDVVVRQEESKSKKQSRTNASAGAAEVTPSKPDAATAEPKGGYRKFERYINKNRRYTEAAKNNQIKGQVVLRFRVDRDGEVKDIKVIKRLGHGLDEEAIRLLKEGPEWKNKTPHPLVTTSVTIKFE